MADSIWGTSCRLDEGLFRAAYEFDFFQAVRLLCLMEGERAGESHARRVVEQIRFRVQPSMSFPASSVVSIARTSKRLPTSDETRPEESPWSFLEENDDRDEEELPLEMTVAFLGLIGPSHVLPDSYTELALHQGAYGDESFAAFFDLFHRRLLALYYRAWEKHQFTVGQEQTGGGRDAISGYLKDLIGMGTAGLEGRLPFADHTLLRYAGLLAQRPRSAECLRTLLCDYLGVAIKVEQFRGRWHRLEEEELTVLGSGDPSSQLGEGAAAGDMVWNLQSLIRVVLGPLSAELFFEFLPDGRRFDVVTGLVRWYLGPAIDFELQPLLASGVAPSWGALGLPASGDHGRRSRLGWSTWLTAEPFLTPGDDAVFSENELVAMED